MNDIFYNIGIDKKKNMPLSSDHIWKLKVKIWFVFSWVDAAYIILKKLG
jgi:hypothetical protein